MGKPANYRIVGAALIIEDLGPWDRHLTVTNDIERVCKELWDAGALQGKRLFYVDSMGEFTEAKHNKGVFIDFDTIGYLD